MKHPIKRPTFEEHIKHMFIPDDIDCMHGRIDLTSFHVVRLNAPKIENRIADGSMPPPDTGRKWTADELQTFRNWANNTGFRQYPYVRISQSKKPRIRKSLHQIEKSSNELDLLRKAFSGLKARDKDRNDPTSFFNLAGIHWLPGPDEKFPTQNNDCRHHDDPYNPWHRAYLIAFENALRTIEGCEEVTLPYWDILGEKLPDWVYEEPFFPYEIPYKLESLDKIDVFEEGYPIERYSAAQIAENVVNDKTNIADQIAMAMEADNWFDFNGWNFSPRIHKAIIRAHDAGHGACGNTIANQDIAAFDPLFWFFHCNWDRLFWKWQQDKKITTGTAFEKFVTGDKSWLNDNSLTILTPFDVNSHEMIDLSAWNINYQHPPDTPLEFDERLILASGNVQVEKSFLIASMDRYSVRVKDINRLNIRGSFDVVLYSGERIIDRTYIFQPSSPRNCDTCVKNGVFSTDFIVDKKDISIEEALRVAIKTRKQNGEWEEIPLSEAGNPTLNIRLLLNSDEAWGDLS